MKVGFRNLSGALAFSFLATPAAAADGKPKTTLDVIQAYEERSFARDLDGTTSLFANDEDVYFHINNIHYFTIDADQDIFQIVNARSYIDGWDGIHQGFSDYFDFLVQALDVRTTTRTSGPGMGAPLDGGAAIDGETNYLILARFYLDAEGTTGWAIVHGLDQFRVKHHKITNINNIEKTVFLTTQESAGLDAMASDAARIAWARDRTCELVNSVFATIDAEKRDDIGLACE